MWQAFGNLEQNTNIVDRFIPYHNKIEKGSFFLPSKWEHKNKHFIDEILGHNKRLLNFNKNSTAN